MWEITVIRSRIKRLIIDMSMLYKLPLPIQFAIFMILEQLINFS